MDRTALLTSNVFLSVKILGY